MKTLRLSVKDYVIKKYIGAEVFMSVSKETRFILLKDALKQFKMEMRNKYGSDYNYMLHLIKERGYKSYTEYANELAKSLGFKNDYERRKKHLEENGLTLNQYLNELSKDKGFKNRYEEEMKRAKKRGLNSRIELLNKRARDKGFKSHYQRVKECGWKKNAKKKKDYSEDFKKFKHKRLR